MKEKNFSRDIQLRIRLSQKEAEKLEYCSKQKNMSKSKIVREGVDRIYNSIIEGGEKMKKVVLYDHYGYAIDEIETDKSLTKDPWGITFEVELCYFNIGCEEILDKKREIIDRIKEILDAHNEVRLLVKRNADKEFTVYGIISPNLK